MFGICELAEVIILPKPGNAPNNLISYRPIPPLPVIAIQKSEEVLS